MRDIFTLTTLLALIACGEQATVGIDDPPPGREDGRAFSALSDVVGSVYLNSDSFGGMSAAVSVGKSAFSLPQGPTLDQCVQRGNSGAGLIGSLNGVLQPTGAFDLGAPVSLSAGGRTIALDRCTDGACTDFFVYRHDNPSDDSDYLSEQAYTLRAPMSALAELESAVIAAQKFGISAPAGGAIFSPDAPLELNWSGTSDGFIYVIIQGDDPEGGSGIECVLKDDGAYTVSVAELGGLPVSPGARVGVELNRVRLTSQEVSSLGGSVVGVSISEANVSLLTLANNPEDEACRKYCERIIECDPNEPDAAGCAAGCPADLAMLSDPCRQAFVDYVACAERQTCSDPGVPFPDNVGACASEGGATFLNCVQ